MLNGSGIAGIAGRTKARLEEMGCNVISIGDYSGEFQNGTRILVKDNTDCSALEAQLKNSKTEAWADFSEDCDILIITGKQAE